MADQQERSAYPHPENFEVMRPEYIEQDDGFVKAIITVSPFRVSGQSATRAGARRAALYEAQKTYRNYHPSYPIKNPYPQEFTDSEGMRWKRVSKQRREELGDYIFTDEYDEQDYVGIDTMLMWDVRPVDTPEEEETSA